MLSSKGSKPNAASAYKLETVFFLFFHFWYYERHTEYMLRFSEGCSNYIIKVNVPTQIPSIHYQTWKSPWSNRESNLGPSF